jgi:hypothetical protein
MPIDGSACWFRGLRLQTLVQLGHQSLDHGVQVQRSVIVQRSQLRPFVAISLKREVLRAPTTRTVPSSTGNMC